MTDLAPIKTILPSLVLLSCFIVGCQSTDPTPLGFQVLGSKTPDRYNEYPVPEGFVEKLPEKLNTEKLRCTIPEKRRGYVVFARNYLDLVYPGTQPLRSEVTEEISLFSAKGEYEPVTFSVNAWRNLENLRAVAGPLTKDGVVIPTQCIDLRSVRCVPRRVWRENSYIVKPTMLEKRESVNVKRGRSQRFWMTVWTPKGQEPGIYTGTVTIQADGVKSFTLKVKHEVMDLELEPSNIPQGMYYFAIDRVAEGMPPLPDETLYKDMINMKEHGMNTLMLLVPPEVPLQTDDDGTLSYDMTPLRGVRDAVLAAEFCSVIHNTTIDCIYWNPKEKDGEKLVGLYVEALEKEGWPEVIYSYGDETDAHPGRVNVAIKRHKHFKRIRPDLRTSMTIAFPENSEMFDPHLDIRLFSGYAGKVAREKTREAGREFWIYSGASGYGMDARGDRFWRGIWAKTLELEGALDWAYISTGVPAQPFNDLILERHRDNFTCWVFPGDDGPIPTPGWEGLREGIEDWRYICRLEKLIEKATEASGNPQLPILAMATRMMLETVLNDVDNKPIAHKKETVVNRERDEPPFDDPAFYDKFRRQMAGYILLLEKALAEGIAG
jgi:hypothetical protein